MLDRNDELRLSAVRRGRPDAVVRDLDTAIKQDVRSANQIFSTGRIEPDANRDSCTWSQADFDALSTRFPTDYRPPLYRGLYFSYFATFDDTYAEQAIQDFRRASALNPQAPLPHYLIGNLQVRGATLLAGASATARDDARRLAIQSLTRAIVLDPTLVPALEIRANEYSHLERYLDAIKDYDAVLTLEPANASAYNDWGLARLELDQNYAAVWDFSESIRRKDPEDSTLGMTYQHRADTYAMVGDFRNAVADLTKAIEWQLANTGLAINMRRFRELYPEYDSVSDEVVSRKLWATFWPDLTYEGFADRFLDGSRDSSLNLVLADLYVSRGDAYLRLGAFRSAVADYNRVFQAHPNYAGSIDRWRPLSAGIGGDGYFIDMKSMELPANGVGRTWLKTTSSAQTYTLQAFDINCRTDRLRATSVVDYDAAGRAVRSLDAIGAWRQVVPGTIGERLYDGLCTASEHQ